jgi:hypothetical protein
MAFEAHIEARKEPSEADMQKRALLGKLAEDAVVELRSENGNVQSEGEIFSQERILEGSIRHETQLFMSKRQAEVTIEREKLKSENADFARSAEAAADAVLLEQTRSELAMTSLNVQTEAGIASARVRTEQLIDKALGVKGETTNSMSQLNLERAVAPGANPAERPQMIQKQITSYENEIRSRTARQFENVKKPEKAVEALQTNTSDYAELLPLYRQELSIPELRAIGGRITFEGITLTQLYETNQLDEAGMRRVVAEFLTGGNIEAAIAAEKQSYEGRFERDPRMRGKRLAGMIPIDVSKDTDNGTLQVLGQTASQAPLVVPDATTNKFKSQSKSDKETLTLSQAAEASLKTIKSLNKRQIIIVAGVGLFMLALIFITLALTK